MGYGVVEEKIVKIRIPSDMEVEEAEEAIRAYLKKI
jgi:hypothetical protein